MSEDKDDTEEAFELFSRALAPRTSPTKERVDSCAKLVQDVATEAGKAGFKLDMTPTSWSIPGANGGKVTVAVEQVEICVSIVKPGASSVATRLPPPDVVYHFGSKRWVGTKFRNKRRCRAVDAVAERVIEGLEMLETTK